jgi:hypothetical protein
MRLAMQIFMAVAIVLAMVAAPLAVAVPPSAASTGTPAPNASTSADASPSAANPVASPPNQQNAPILICPDKGNGTSGLKWDSSGSDDLVDGVIELGGTLHLKATGDTCRQIQREAAENGGLGALSLVLKGIPMAKLPSSWSRCDGSPDALCIRFDLVRDSNDEDQRTAWNLLLRKLKHGAMDLEPRLAVGNDVPLWIEGAPKFRVASRTFVNATFLLCSLGFLGAFLFTVRHPTILRSEGSRRYSLGKSQMAFWGLLVVSSFVGVWIVAGTMEHVPAQVLILLGISAATGLSAVVIDAGDDPMVLARRRELVQAEAATLVAANPQDAIAIAKAANDLAYLDLKLANRNRNLVPKGFVRDICGDDDGMSFNRMQVAIWTVVLGAVFVQYVAQVMSMPEFPETLLTLMGISNATYIGYKLPGK